MTYVKINTVASLAPLKGAMKGMRDLFRRLEDLTGTDPVTLRKIGLGKFLSLHTSSRRASDFRRYVGNLSMRTKVREFSMSRTSQWPRKFVLER